MTKGKRKKKDFIIVNVLYILYINIYIFVNNIYDINILCYMYIG